MKIEEFATFIRNLGEAGIPHNTYKHGVRDLKLRSHDATWRHGCGALEFFVCRQYSERPDPVQGTTEAFW